MKVLVIGGGGREHTLVWKLAQSPRVSKLYCAPGNAGIAAQATCVPIGATEIDKLVAFAVSTQIEFTVVGPEAPLCAGVVDAFQAKGLKIFGPNRAAAQLEGSKVFCKDLLLKSRVPTATAGIFDQAAAARAYLQKVGAPIVVKADGLAAGKGVIVAQTVAEAEAAIDLIMEQKAFGDAGARVVIEECLVGQEASVMALVDGRTFALLAPSQDHKRVGDHDRGPNTGGMGAYSPTPAVTADLDDTLHEIFRRSIDGLLSQGIEFRGVMYAGLMLTADGPKVLEFNARFGDPETQAVLPRMDFDLLDALERTAEGRLDGFAMRWKSDQAVCVVMASGGYPGKYASGKVITGLADAERLGQVAVFHAGTKFNDQQQVVTDGGRVLGVTAWDADLSRAVERAYAAVERIRFDGAHYRRDIAARALAPRT